MSPTRQPFKRGVSFNAQGDSGVRPPPLPPHKWMHPHVLHPLASTPASASSPAPTIAVTVNKSASFSSSKPPPRRLSWFSSSPSNSHNDTSSRRANKVRTLSVDHQPDQLAQIGSAATGNDDELLSPQQSQQPSSPFGVFNHLRSSFKHYTSGKSRNNNKDIAS